MANFTNYQEGKAAMLMVETQQRDVGTKSAAANGDGSVGEPPSPLINIGGGGGGGSRFHQHLPPSNHLHHHLLGHHHTPKDHHYQLAPQHLSGEESPGRKASSSSLSQVHTAEDPAASSAASSHVYAAVNVANTSDAVDDIRKCGYLRKQKHGHKRFFVLRAASHLGPSRLEYYDSEKKFRNSLRSAAAAAASGGAVAPSPPKRVIYLYQCFTVNKRADSKNKHLIALYTKDEYFAIVAENEQEQEDWYVAVSELMSEGKKGHVDSDDLDDGYGTVTPGTVFKEVWQVNVKPKGLGQTKNLTGVYRLCLSTKTIHLVKLNSETPCVNLQLMNIRRCGHSESFFFIEVGRSSSIGPGEIWMQVDDSVVAQNMHETILETMKALKAFAEFRPRSKSQSSGSNPMPFITTRRHLGNLPPSQTGLQRRSRTESVVGTPPSSKSSGASGYRFRTSSEGEGTMNRPFRSATGSLVHLNTARVHHCRQEGGGSSSGGSGVATGNTGTSTGSGRYVRAIPGSSSTYHTRSASLPVSHFPSTTSPVSVSSSSGHGSVSDTLTRPSSASICGSPSDGGFNSSDEYGSSPGDFRYFRVRSNTPDSLGNTPPIREENCLNDYMAMGWNREVFGTSGGSGNNSGGDTPRDESTSTTEDERFSSSSLRRRTQSFSRPAGGATGGSGVAVYQKMTQTNFSLDEGSDVVLPFGSGLLRGGPSSSSSSLRSDYSSCSEHSQQSRPSTLSRTEASGERPPLSSSASAKEDSGYMPMMCGVAASPRDTPPDYMPMQPSSYSHPISHSPQFHSPALGPRSAQLQSQSSTDSHGYMMMLPGGSGSSPSPGQASPSPQSSSSMTGASGSDSIAERPENGEYMDMSYCSSGGPKLSNEGSSGYYTPGTPEGTPKSYSPYFSLPRSYKAPTRERDEKEYGEYVPMSSPAKPVYSSVATASTSTPEKRIGGGSSTSTPSHPPPPYGAHHTTTPMADRRVARPNRLPLGRRSFHGPLRVSEPSTASAGTSTSVPATVSSSEGPSSPGEYINIEFGDHYPHQQQPPAYPLSAQDEAPSLGSIDQRHSPHQDYMSVEVAADQQDNTGCLSKNQSPRPSLVAPWNPPSYIRPLASNPGVVASPGVPAGGHWRSMGDDYTDMTFNLSRGDRTQTSPTAMLQHLCVIEGRYGHASPSSISPPLPPSSPGRAPPQQLEPKVVRADPQGRRRHSSETFSSTSSSNSTPPGGGLAPSSSATHPTLANTTAPNSSYLMEGQASRWASSASFDSMWVSMEGLGDSTAHAPVRATEMGAASGTSASSSSSSSGAGSGRMCRNMSVGYQNGLNYIALELREDGSNSGAMASGAGSSNGSSGAAAGTVPMPENGAYASIDFTKSDGVTTTTKD